MVEPCHFQFLNIQKVQKAARSMGLEDKNGN